MRKLVAVAITVPAGGVISGTSQRFDDADDMAEETAESSDGAAEFCFDRRGSPDRAKRKSSARGVAAPRGILHLARWVDGDDAHSSTTCARS